ncbi:nucleoid-structuring protein H-NS [Mycobacterium sp. NBC_00419]|uniref:Rv3852 family protein n=1 Tax=Mycobacterium sp. NBC_00419 TaxID=2975989 RepID=UPI002E1F5EA7
MAEAQDQPEQGGATPPEPQQPEEAVAKKAPAKKAPAKKAVKKAPAKKAPAKKAPAKKVAPPALEAPATHAALAAGNGSPPVAEAAREAAANAKSTVEQAASPLSTPSVPAVPEPGRSPLPFAVAFAVTVLLALLIRRLRR